MPEFKYAKGRISESLQFIAGELKEFDNDYSSRTLEEYQKDKKLEKLMDRTVENILTALIEICGTILVQKNIPVENYAQILGKCAEQFGFSQEDQESFSKLAIQRNRIAHRYLNFRWQAIKAFSGTKPLISELLAKILEREKEQNQPTS